MSPRTRGPSRGLSGIPDAPTAFTFKSSKSRGGPQTEQEQEGSVNVKGNQKNRPLPSNQRTGILGQSEGHKLFHSKTQEYFYY